MSISMIGIDHSRASVDIRARFSFTRKNAVSAMERLKEDKDILGCIILSTCNRMEIWASVQDDWEGSLTVFCAGKKKFARRSTGSFSSQEKAVRQWSICSI